MVVRCDCGFSRSLLAADAPFRADAVNSRSPTFPTARSTISRARRRRRVRAVSDVANVLAIGHKPGEEPHVSLFSLDGRDSRRETGAADAARLPPPIRRSYPLCLRST